MPDLTPRMILDAIHEGLEESALLVAQGYDPSQGRPRPYPDEWIRAISGAITGRPNAPIGEVIAALRHGPSRRVSPSP